jgi:hypothetical protein
MSALKKITTEAKKIFKKGGSWKAAIKAASAKYRAGKISGPTRKKKAAPKKKAAKRRAVVRKVKSLHRAEGAAIKKLSGVTVAHHISQAKTKLVNSIASAEARKFTAVKKSAKRKIAKSISALKSKYRKLC